MFGALLTLGVTVVKSTVAATSLSMLGPERLPWLYLASSLVVTVGSVVLGARAKARRPAKLLALSSRYVAVGLLATVVVSRFSAALSAGVLFVLAEAYATLLSVMFWAALADAMTVRQQRRSFTHFAAANMLGVLLGGLSMRLVPGVVSPSSAILIVAFALAWMPTLLTSLPRASLQSTEQSSQRVKALMGSRLAPLILGFVLLAAITSASVDFSFRRHAHAAYAEQDWALLFGDLNSIVAVIGLVVQLVLGQRLLSRIGLFGVLALVPAAMLGLSCWTLMRPDDSLAWFSQKTFDMVAAYALLPAAGQLLYNGLPATERTTLRALIDGTGKRLGTAVGALLLLALSASVVWTPALPIGFALLSLAILPPLRRQYIASLASSLHQHSEASRESPIDPQDASTQAALRDALGSARGAQVLGAIEVLSRVEHFDFSAYLPSMLQHDDWQVRVAAIKLVEQGLHTSEVGLVTRLLRDRDVSVRRQAAVGLTKISPVHAIAALEPQLRDEADATMRAAAITALWKSRLRRDLADESLKQLLVKIDTLDVSMKVELARVLGALGTSPYSLWLQRLLLDGSARVRRAAAKACGEARDPTLVPALLDRLADHEMALSVREALITFADAAVPRIWALLDDRTAPLQLRMKLPRLLEGIATEGAAEAALFSNPTDDPALQHRLIATLLHLRMHNRDLRFDRARTDEAALRKLALYAELQPLVTALREGSPAFRSLSRATFRRQQECALDVCAILSLTREPRPFAAVAAGLREGRHLADSLELLDEALRGDSLREKVLATLEPTAAHKTHLDTPEQAARRLTTSGDALLRALSRHSLERAGLEAGVPLVSTIFQWLSQRKPNEPGEAGGDASLREPVTIEASIIERTLILEALPLFAGVSIDDLAAVAEVAEMRTYQPQQVVFKKGDLGDEMYVVVSGSVQLMKGSRALFRISENELFGQVSLLDRGPRPVDAQVFDKPATLLVIRRQSFMEIVVDRPELLNAVFAVLTRRIRDLIERDGAADTSV